jgi:hypothetical protein
MRKRRQAVKLMNPERGRISVFEHHEKSIGAEKFTAETQRRGEMQKHKATDAGQRNDFYSTGLHSPDERLKLVVHG